MLEENYSFISANNGFDVNYMFVQAENLYPKVNIVIAICFILIGFVGNFLVIGIFCRKKFRSNPSQVLILFTAIIDNLFLIVHFFEVNNCFFRTQIKCNTSSSGLNN